MSKVQIYIDDNIVVERELSDLIISTTEHETSQVVDREGLHGNYKKYHITIERIKND